MKTISVDVLVPDWFDEDETASDDYLGMQAAAQGYADSLTGPEFRAAQLLAAAAKSREMNRTLGGYAGSSLDTSLAVTGVTGKAGVSGFTIRVVDEQGRARLYRVDVKEVTR